MTTPDLPDWLAPGLRGTGHTTDQPEEGATMTDRFAPGTPVRAWRGYDESTPGPVMTVDRVTQTQIITDGGVRWSRKTMCRVGDHGYRAECLYRADDPRIAEAAGRVAAKAARAKVAGALKDAAGWWVNHPNNDRAAALRDAIIAVSPHIGLAIDPDAPALRAALGLGPDQTVCGARVGPDGQACLKPAGHVDVSGEGWHSGIGWTSSGGESGA